MNNIINVTFSNFYGCSYVQCNDAKLNLLNPNLHGCMHYRWVSNNCSLYTAYGVTTVLNATKQELEHTPVKTRGRSVYIMYILYIRMSLIFMVPPHKCFEPLNEVLNQITMCTSILHFYDLDRRVAV